MKLSAVRKSRFDYTVDFAGSLGIDINDWKRNPYTYFKSRFYIEFSSILAFLLMRTNIHPTVITLLYGACGVLGGVLFAIPTTPTIIAGIVVFFSKGILDWSDGLLARLTGRTSTRGAILDPWGALLNSLGFQVGVSLYVCHKVGDPLYFYLVIVILTLRAADVAHYSYRYFLNAILTGKGPTPVKPGDTTSAPTNSVAPTKPFLRVRRAISGFLDDRARSVDFVCLVVIIELLYPQVFVTKYIVWGWVAKYTLVFFGGLFRVIKANWIERTEESLGHALGKMQR